MLHDNANDEQTSVHDVLINALGGGRATGSHAPLQAMQSVGDDETTTQYTDLAIHAAMRQVNLEHQSSDHSLSEYLPPDLVAMLSRA